MGHGKVYIFLCKWIGWVTLKVFSKSCKFSAQQLCNEKELGLD